MLLKTNLPSRDVLTKGNRKTDSKQKVKVNRSNASWENKTTPCRPCSLHVSWGTWVKSATNWIGMSGCNWRHEGGLSQHQKISSGEKPSEHDAPQILEMPDNCPPQRECFVSASCFSLNTLNRGKRNGFEWVIWASLHNMRNFYLFLQDKYPRGSKLFKSHSVSFPSIIQLSQPLVLPEVLMRRRIAFTDCHVMLSEWISAKSVSAFSILHLSWNSLSVNPRESEKHPIRRFTGDSLPSTHTLITQHSHWHHMAASKWTHDWPIAN